MATRPDLTPYGSCTLADAGCPSCGEGAVPVIVRAIRDGLAEVEDREGRRAHVALDFVPEVSVGDVLLVQAGLALSRVAQGVNA